MVLRVDLIADIYLTSSIPMVPFRTTWKLHMDFIEKSCNCFPSKRNFFFFFFHFLWTFVRIRWSFHSKEYFYSFIVIRDSIFSCWKIFFCFMLLRSFLSFKITFLPPTSSRALVNFINCASYIRITYLPTSFESQSFVIFNKKICKLFFLYISKKEKK